MRKTAITLQPSFLHIPAQTSFETYNIRIQYIWSIKYFITKTLPPAISWQTSCFHLIFRRVQFKLRLCKVLVNVTIICTYFVVFLGSDCKRSCCGFDYNSRKFFFFLTLVIRHSAALSSAAQHANRVESGEWKVF